MDRPVARLGTAPAVTTAQVKEKVGRFRSRFVDREFGYRDWTVDGAPLRRLIAWPNGDVAGDVTPIQNDRAGSELALATLHTLLGHGTAADPETTLPDGRVALLFCPSCFDFGCGALTAELVVAEEHVQWRDIAWQTDYAPLDLGDQDSSVVSLTFERQQYEHLLRDLLEVELRRAAD